jgi:hypothetical protein
MIDEVSAVKGGYQRIEVPHVGPDDLHIQTGDCLGSLELGDDRAHALPAADQFADKNIPDVPGRTGDDNHGSLSN